MNQKEIVSLLESVIAAKSTTDEQRKGCRRAIASLRQRDGKFGQEKKDPPLPWMRSDDNVDPEEKAQAHGGLDPFDRRQLDVAFGTGSAAPAPSATFDARTRQTKLSVLGGTVTK
jgi:hypothetical protein